MSPKLYQNKREGLKTHHKYLKIFEFEFFENADVDGTDRPEKTNANLLTELSYLFSISYHF